MKIKQIEEGDALQVFDPIHMDFIYVFYGFIKVTLEMKKHNNTIDEQIVYFKKGEYMDDFWKRDKFPDHNIKEIVCASKTEDEV